MVRGPGGKALGSEEVSETLEVPVEPEIVLNCAEQRFVYCSAKCIP